MKDRGYLGISLFFIVVHAVFVLSCAVLCAQEPVAPAVDSQDTSIKTLPLIMPHLNGAELKEKVIETKDVIKKKEEDTTKAILEAEKVIEEKKVIERDAKLKEQAATIAKKELEVVKEEAAVTKDPDAIKKVKTLSKEAEQLTAESELYKKKLDLAESKEKIVQETILANKNEIAILTKELLQLKKQLLASRSLSEKATRAAVVIFIGFVLILIIRYGVHKFVNMMTPDNVIRESDTTLRLKTLISLFNWLGTIIIAMVVCYFLLDTFGLNVTPLLAGAGVAGIAFGFGGQYLIRDMINGLFILIEDQYRIDDVVEIAGQRGLVKDVNLRITTLKDLEGRILFIPNGEIKSVINYTKKHSRALLKIGVAYKENVDQVINVIKDIGQEMRKDPHYKTLIREDLEMLGVDDFAESSVVIAFRVKTLPIKQWEVAREFRRRIKNRFDELGIEIPFPHRTLYWGSGTSKEPRDTL